MDLSMPIGSLLGAVAVLLLAGLYIAKPLIQPRYAPPSSPTPEDDLIAQKDAIVQQIRELEFDHDTGKVPDELFAPQREALVQQAAALYRQIDALDSAESSIPSANVDDEIEAAVARLRQVSDTR